RRRTALHGERAVGQGAQLSRVEHRDRSRARVVRALREPAGPPWRERARGARVQVRTRARRRSGDDRAGARAAAGVTEEMPEKNGVRHPFFGTGRASVGLPWSKKGCLTPFFFPPTSPAAATA